MVAAAEEFGFDEFFERRADGSAFGEPEAESLADVVGDAEQAQSLAEHAVIAFAGFFELFEPGFQVFTIEVGGAVEPLQSGSGGVSFPEGGGDAGDLEGLDLSGMRNVGAATEVEEFALPVKAECGVFGKSGANVFGLERLAKVGAKCECFFAAGFEAFERFGRIDDALHFGFNAREVVFADGSGKIEVVVEAVASRGAEGETGSWKQSHDGASHHVCAAVAEHSECFRVTFGDESNRYGALRREIRKGTHAVHDCAVDGGSDSGFRESFADSSGDIESSCG